MTEQEEAWKETVPPISESAPIAPNAEEKTGYGRPPKHTQFKPGQSGNLKGRPKGSRNFGKILVDEINATAEFTERGRKFRLPKGQIAIRQMINKAATGDPKAFSAVMHWLEKLDALKNSPPTAPSVVTEQTSETLKELTEFFRSAATKSDREPPENS